MTYLRKAWAYYSETGYYSFVESVPMPGASGFSIQARIRVLLSPQRSEAQLVSKPIIFLGVKWVLRECSSNINGSRVTIHAKKTCRDGSRCLEIVKNMLHLQEFKPRIFQIIYLSLYRLSYRGL